MNCKQANALPIASVLEELGVRLSKARQEDAFYYAANRQENTPSLHVSFRKNTWYDFGEQKGGGVIDLVRYALDMDVAGALEFLNNRYSHFSSFQQQKTTKSPVPGKRLEQRPSPFREVQVRPLCTQELFAYALERGIPSKLLNSYCLEVSYALGNTGKLYTAIGFPNNSGGYELRNRNFKGCMGSKDISVIKCSSGPVVSVFEGFMDMLSLVVFQGKQIENTILVLNSVSNVAKACDFLSKEIAQIHCYLDRDVAGEKALKQIQEIFPEALDMSELYTGYKDLNDCLISQMISNEGRTVMY